MRNLRVTVFYMKTNVLQNFHICISVPLNVLLQSLFPLKQFNCHIFQYDFFLLVGAEILV